MSQDLKQFHFTVRNSKGIETKFLGDGKNMVEAFIDGLDNAIEHGLKRSVIEDNPKPEVEDPDL